MSLSLLHGHKSRVLGAGLVVLIVNVIGYLFRRRRVDAASVSPRVRCAILT